MTAGLSIMLDPVCGALGGHNTLSYLQWSQGYTVPRLDATNRIEMLVSYPRHPDLTDLPC